MAGWTDWQGVFALLLVIGVVLMLCSARLPETLLPEMRIHKNVLQVYANLFRVFRNGRFTLSTLSAVACFFTFFAYIASSPFILQQLYGLSPLQFSLCFGLNAFMIGIGAALAPQFKWQGKALKCGAIDFVIAAVGLSLCLLFHLPLLLLMACYIYLLTSFGLMQPGLTAIALDSERENAGAASAIFGAAGFVSGAVSSPIVAMGRIEITSSMVVLSGAVVCLVLVLTLCRKIRTM